MKNENKSNAAKELWENPEFRAKMVTIRRDRAPRKDGFKFTAEQIAEIRDAYAAGEFQASLAKRFNTTQCYISRIVNRKVHKHT